MVLGEARDWQCAAEKFRLVAIARCRWTTLLRAFSG